MAKKHLMLLVSLMLVLSLFLAACTDKKAEKGTEKEPEKPETKVEEKVEDPVEEPGADLDFPLSVSNSSAVIEDGELSVALVSDTPFEGTLNPVFYSGDRMLE